MNIQTAAFKLGKKSNKKDAQSMIETMYHESECERDRHYLANLYKHFQPSEPKKCKTVYEWVDKAKSKDPYEPHIGLMYYDGKNIVATDGKRLHSTHVSLDSSLNNQFIDVEGNIIESKYTFPNYKRVMPEHKFKDELLRENFTYNDRGDVVTNLFGLEYTFNKKYLDDALNGNNQADIACEKADGKSQVCITTHVGGHPVNAILMPKKVK